MTGPWNESVNGIVIGDITWLYEFWTTAGDEPAKPIARGLHFSSDAKAIAWFKEHYLIEFAQGVEMRVFDCDPA